MRAAGCNFFDILMVQGKYQVKPPFPFVPGAEIAGVVRAVGDGVKGFAKGDRVLASAGLGGFAEIAVVPAAGAYRMPEGMSFDEGAALPIIYPTSYAGARLPRAPGGRRDAARARGRGRCRHRRGADRQGARRARDRHRRRRREARDRARERRRRDASTTRKEDFVERVKQLTGGRGADVIYDSVGGDTFDQSLKCIAWNGRLLVIGFAGGRIPEVKANRILLKNISIVGLHWGAHVQNEPARIPETFQALFELYRAGKIRPVIFKSYPLEEVSVALEALGSRKTWGKVIVAP